MAADGDNLSACRHGEQTADNLWRDSKMAEIRPFRGVRYQTDRLGNPGAVVSPPYDVVSLAMQRRLLDAHPHNVIRLELPTGEDGQGAYHVAERTYREWLTSGVLIREATPALYPYAQTF